MTREVAFYVKEDEGVFVCQICPHNCHLKEGMKGVCGVRQVEDNILTAINYGKVSSLALDPIEKNPYTTIGQIKTFYLQEVLVATLPVDFAKTIQ